MIGDGGGRCEVEEEVEGRERLERTLMGDVGVAMGNVSARCSTVGVKRLVARSVVGEKRGSGCGGEARPAIGWEIPNDSEETLMTSGGVLTPGRRERDDTRESFSSGDGKR